MSDQVIYTVGGTVQAGGGIYISRDADEQLLRLCRAGEFCYVLAARQTGKSSLMVATQERLATEGIRTVEIDLTEMGSGLSGLTVEQWYLGLMDLIVDQLDLDVDYMAWWDERVHLGPTQRLSQFLRQVVLEQVSEPVVIFIDEIDFTLNLDFTDDFFAAIRACYNARARDPVFKRLSFALLGVATPSDLISAPQRTPFNIGQRIDLTDFTNREAIPLAGGLGLPPVEAGQALIWILDWTGGHPYLTQRLCAAAATSPTKNWDAMAVEELVEKTFFGEQSAQDSNLQFVRDMLTQRAPDKAAVLKTYHRIHAGQTVPDEERSVVKTHLKLSGVVKRKEGNLTIRNRIYDQVFNQEWISQNMPRDWARRIAVISTILVLVLGGLFVYYRTYIQPQQTTEARAQVFVDSFRGTTSADVRANSLTGLFILGEIDPKYETQAHELFTTLTADGKAATLVSLFKLGETDPKYETQAHELFTTLTADGKAATLVSLFKLGETDPKHEEQTRQLFTTLTFDERVATLASLLKLGETDPESKELAYQFFTPLTPDEKMVTLASLFEPLGLDRARAFFYEELTPEEQLALFGESAPGSISTQLIIVIKKLYTELEDDDQDNQLLEAMAQPLRELDEPIAVNLVKEIQQWLIGRDHHAKGEYQQAIKAYSDAIDLNDVNPGLYFDRGRSYAKLRQYEEALTDLNETVRLDGRRIAIVDQEIRSNDALFVALKANVDLYQALAYSVYGFQSGRVACTPNCGTTGVKGVVYDVNANYVPGLIVKVWTDGWCCGEDETSTYTPYEIMLSPGARGGHWYVAVYSHDGSTQLSDVVDVYTDWEPCAPDSDGCQWVEVDFVARGIDFVVVQRRILPKEGDECPTDHYLYTRVIDAYGAPLDGIVLNVSWSEGEKEIVTGEKGPGRAEFTMYGSYWVQVVRDRGGRVYTSEIAEQLSSTNPVLDDLIAAGYCEGMSTQECAEQRDLGPGHLCYGHYSYEVVFQRQW